MTRKYSILFLLFFCLIEHQMFSQEIVDIYKEIPEKLTDLNARQKDSLFKYKKYVTPDSDSSSTIVYYIDTIDVQNNYLRINYRYTTGQAGWVKFEFRLFESKSKKYLVASKIGGVRVSHQQDYLNIYMVNKDNSITLLKPSWTINELEFFETYTGKDFLIANEGMFCFNYEIRPSAFPNGIAYTANPCYTLDSRIAEIQKKTIIKINWTGQDFVKENN